MKKFLKAIALILLITAAVFAAGCAEKPASPGNETVTPGNETVTPGSETVTAGNETVTPGSESVTPGSETTEKGQIVNENDSGKTISLKNGESFTLNLRENPSMGYAWELNMSKDLKILSNKYTEDPAPSGQAGVPGTRSWIIQSKALGIQQVNGIYKRPWENTTGKEKNFTLTVEVA